MPEAVRFHFDPLCPWCWQTSKWARRLEALGEVELDWGLFSLELENGDDDPSVLTAPGTRAGLSLRTAVAVRRAAGRPAVGAFYAALGDRIHERGEPAAEAATVTGALADARLDPGLAEAASADPSTVDEVVAEHRALRDRTRSFGVPTIVLDGGEGPAIFGPVISEVPPDDEAVELFRHVAWLTRCETFSELKRDRVAAPDLESVRRRRAEREAAAAKEAAR